MADRQGRFDAFYRLADVDRTFDSRRSACFNARFDCRTFVVYSEFRSDSFGSSGDFARFYRQSDNARFTSSRLFVGVQLIESNLVTPLIERQTVELPPALTIVSQLVLAVLIGGLGLVLATPILAVVMVLIQMLYIQDVLGDKDTEINAENLEEVSAEKIFNAKTQRRKGAKIWKRRCGK